MKQKRNVSEIPENELDLYDHAWQRWQDMPPNQILGEAAAIFNLAVFLARQRAESTIGKGRWVRGKPGAVGQK